MTSLDNGREGLWASSNVFSSFGITKIDLGAKGAVSTL